MPFMRSLPGPPVGAQRNSQHRRCHWRTPRMCSRVGCRFQTGRPRSDDSTARTHGSNITSDRSLQHHCCVWTQCGSRFFSGIFQSSSSSEEMLRSRESTEFSAVHLFWTAHGRPDPAVVRTMAASRDGPNTSAAALA